MITFLTALGGAAIGAGLSSYFWGRAIARQIRLGRLIVRGSDNYAD